MFEFTKGEVRDLTIAFIVISFCFAISSVGIDAHGIISILPIIMVGVGAGFILRELAQKFVAMKYGCRAEFKLWPIGLLVAFVTSFFGFVFALMGEVKIYADNITDELDGKISVAGPMANMALALIFIAIAILVYPFKVHSGFLI